MSAGVLGLVEVVAPLDLDERLVPWLDEAFEERERGLGYGVQNLLYAAGYAIGPTPGGWLLELSGADIAYLVTAGAIAAGTLLLLLRRPDV